MLEEGLKYIYTTHFVHLTNLNPGDRLCIVHKDPADQESEVFIYKQKGLIV